MKPIDIKNIDIYCEKHGICPQTLIDTYEQSLKQISNNSKGEICDYCTCLKDDTITICPECMEEHYVN